MSFTECKNEFKFVFKTRKKLHNFVNDVKYTFPKVVLKITTFQRRKCMSYTKRQELHISKKRNREDFEKIWINPISNL